MNRRQIEPEFKEYVESKIIPLYESFDRGHRPDHIHSVIESALYLSRFYDVDVMILYAAAAYHDTGVGEDRRLHHLISGRIIRSDRALERWFTPNEIETIAEAAEDHRASSSSEPRSIYGKIIAEADRQIISDTVIRRAVQYSLVNSPSMDAEEHFMIVWNHLRAKYSEGGYMKLWIPESPNVSRLEELRRLINDEKEFRRVFTDIFNQETGGESK